MTRISVDLPAPFSPSTACTSPARTSRSTSANASTAPKRLRMPRSVRSEAGMILEAYRRGSELGARDRQRAGQDLLLRGVDPRPDVWGNPGGQGRVVLQRHHTVPHAELLHLGDEGMILDLLRDRDEGARDVDD